VRLTDDEFIADVELTLNDSELEDMKSTDHPVTLAPAFSGEAVESEDEDIVFLNDVKVEQIGLFANEHEVEELTNNLGEKLNE